MLVDEIKTRMSQAMRDRDEVIKNVLGLAFGEIQTAEARANRPLREDEATAIVRKLLKSNEETLALVSDGVAGCSGAAPRDRRSRGASAEVDARRTGRPRARVRRRADSIGGERRSTAMGIAMKHLKASGAAVDAREVQQAVKASARVSFAPAEEPSCTQPEASAVELVVTGRPR